MTTAVVHGASVPAARIDRRWSSVWLGVGLAFTSATQLRVGGLPLGPGEVLLCGWMLAETTEIVLRGTVALTPLASRYLAFWGLTSLALALGSVTSILGDTWNPEFSRNLPALGLAALSSSLAVLAPGGALRWRVVMRAVLATITPLMLVLAALAALGSKSVGPIAPLYEFRFTGWAENPNQLALVCLPLPFFALDWARADRSWPARPLALALFVGVLVVGVATQSDALMFSWAISTAILTTYAWSRALAGRGRTVLSMLVAAVVLPMSALVTVIALYPRIERFAVERVEETYDNNGQGSDRVALWTHGLEAATRSPVFGLGPGGYSGPARPFDGMEAHNSFIDWTDATGLAGLSLLLVLLGAAGWAAVRAADATAAVSLIALCTFVMFHYVLRQPLFWCYVLAIWSARSEAALRIAGPRPAVL